MENNENYIKALKQILRMKKELIREYQFRIEGIQYDVEQIEKELMKEYQKNGN